MDKNKLEDKSMSSVGIILGICIIGAIVCGILECFSIHTGAIGAIMIIVPITFLVGFCVWQFFKEL